MEELSRFKLAFSCFCRGLNVCPNGLGHLFTATMVILRIFSNWSQSAQPGPAPECLVECGVQSLFRQCQNAEYMNDYGSSLNGLGLK